MNTQGFAQQHLAQLAFTLLAVTAPAFAASKEMIELQRDVAQLQEQTRLLQQSIDTKMAQLQVLAQQSLDSSNKANASVADLARGGVDLGRQVAQPIAALSTRFDGMAQDLQSLQAGVADQNARMSKIQQQLVDLKNAMSTIPAPSSAAPPPSTNGAPGSLPPPSAATDPTMPPISSSQLWNNAKHDMDSNPDLALNEFQDYLKFYRATDLAPNAQFNIGQIHYNQRKLEEAVKDFDQVLEQFPTNPKTPDAHYMKGRALIQLAQRNEAAREFTAVITQFPTSPAAAPSKAALKQLGMNAPGAPPPASRRKR